MDTRDDAWAQTLDIVELEIVNMAILAFNVVIAPIRLNFWERASPPRRLLSVSVVAIDFLSVPDTERFV